MNLVQILALFALAALAYYVISSWLPRRRATLLIRQALGELKEKSDHKLLWQLGIFYDPAESILTVDPKLFLLECDPHLVVGLIDLLLVRIKDQKEGIKAAAEIGKELAKTGEDYRLRLIEVIEPLSIKNVLLYTTWQSMTYHCLSYSR